MTAAAAQLQRLQALLLAAPGFMQALQAVHALELAPGVQACIGAGALRNLVWDHLHGRPLPQSAAELNAADIDVAYFDAGEPPGDERLHQARLAARLPGLPWEVTNQAHVHHWFEAHFGHAVAPLASLTEAVASWPEYATCVAAALQADGRLQIIAPWGLDDLFGLRVRRNPQRVSLDTYRQRCASKRYTELWPQVQVQVQM